MPKSFVISVFCCTLAFKSEACAEHKLKVIIMDNIKGNFTMCGGCSRREKREGMEVGNYYCAIADSVLTNDGVITNDTDATNCVRNGWYKQIP